MPIQQLKFQTSVFTGTTPRKSVGEGLAGLIFSGVDLAKQVDKTNKEVEALDEKAKQDDSVLQASRMSTRYFDEYAKQNIASKSEQEKLDFDNNFKQSLNFGEMEDEVIRNRTETFFNKIISSSQGELFAKQEQDRALNSSVALLDETKQLEDKYYEIMQTEGDPSLFKQYLDTNYTNNKEFKYNPLLTDKDKVNHKKLIDRLVKRTNADVVKYNTELAKINLENLSNQNQTNIDSDKFEDIFYGLKSLDKKMTKNKVYGKLLASGISTLKTDYENKALTGRKWSDIKSEYFGSYIDDIKDRKLVEGIAKIKNKINSEYDIHTQVQGIFKNFDGTKESIDKITYTDTDGSSKYINSEMKKKLSDMFQDGVMSSEIFSSEDKGVMLGKFVQKNPRYGRDLLDSIAKNINSREMNFTADEFKIIDSARNNGYVPSRETSVLLDELDDIADRHNFIKSNPEWINQAKSIFEARDLRREEHKADGIKQREVKQVIDEQIEDITTKSFFGSIASSMLDRGGSTAFSRALSVFGDYEEQIDDFEGLNKQALSRMAYEYYLEGFDVESASNMAVTRLQKQTQGTSLPLTKLEKDKEVEEIMKKSSFFKDIKPSDKEKMIKDYIFSDFTDEIKEKVKSGKNISIIPEDTNNLSSSNYRALISDNNGMILEIKSMDDNYMKKAYINSIGKKEEEIEKTQENVDSLINVFFPEQDEKKRASFTNSLKYGNKNDTLFGGIINEVYQDNKSSVDEYLDIVGNIPNEFKEQQKVFGGKVNKALEETMKDFFSTDTLMEASMVAPGLTQIATVEKVLAGVTRVRNTAVMNSVFKGKDITKTIDDLNMFKTKIFEGRNISQVELDKVNVLTEKVIKNVKNIYLSNRDKLINNKKISIDYKQLNNINKVKDEIVGFKMFKERSVLLDEAIDTLSKGVKNIKVNGFPNSLTLQDAKRAKLINNKKLFEIGNRYKINDKVSTKDIDDIIENIDVLNSLSYDRAIKTIIK